MIIEDAELVNWLSYPDTWEVEDEADENCKAPRILLVPPGQPKPLLVKGRNAVGKSAILEGICFALFGKYLRTGRNADAVRRGAKWATVRVTFTVQTQQGRQRYWVERTVYAKGGSGAAILREDSKDGALVKGNPDEVTDYISKEILHGMTAEAFRATVVLRQGEVGAFMKMGHTAQEMSLLALCRLDIYHTLHKQADDLQKEKAKDAKKLKDDFAEVERATAERVAELEAAVSELLGERDRKQGELREAEVLRSAVQRVAMLTREIAELQKRVDAWTPLLADQDAITYAARWTTAWQSAQGLVAEIRDLQAIVAASSLELAAAAAEEATAGKDYQAAENESQGLNEELAGLVRDQGLTKDVMLELGARRSELEEQRRKAGRSVLLGPKIVRDRAEVERLGPLAADVTTLKSQQASLGKMEQSVAALGVYNEAMKGGVRERATAAQLNEAAQSAETTCRQLEDKIQALTGQLQAAKDRLRQQKQAGIDLAGQIAGEQGKAADRQAAIDNGECPTCGLDMEGEVRHQVMDDLEQIRANIGALQQREAEHQRLIREAEERIQQMEAVKGASAEEAARQRGQVKHNKEQAAMALDRAVRGETEADRKWRQHLKTWPKWPDFLGSPGPAALQAAQAFLTEHADIGHRLEEAVRADTRIAELKRQLDLDEEEWHGLGLDRPASQSEIDSLARQLAEVESKQARAQAENRRLDGEIGPCRVRATATAERAQKRFRALNDVQEQRRSLERDARRNRETLGDKTAELRRRQAVLESDLPQLASILSGAVEDDNTYQFLLAAAAGYEGQASRLGELQVALASWQHTGALLEDKRRALSAEAKTARSESESEVAGRILAINLALQNLDQQILAAQREVGRVAEQSRQRAEIKPKLDRANAEAWVYKQIADALYPGSEANRYQPGPVFRKVTDLLHQRIAEEATDVLLQIGFARAVTYKDKRGFVVTDGLMSDATFSFEELSGGEQFAVAIAMSLAIGRVAHGARNVGCLFVDEGFGALDSETRGQIVADAIMPLMDSQLRDQVVIITHMAELEDQFDRDHIITITKSQDRSFADHSWLHN